MTTTVITNVNVKKPYLILMHHSPTLHPLRKIYLAAIVSSSVSSLLSNRFCRWHKT